MTNLEMPIFSNTCGKLFTDKVIFASALRETEIDTREIKNISFAGSVKTSSLLFLAVPAMLVFIPYFFFHESDVFLKFLVTVLGVAFFTIAVIKAQKSYRLKVNLKNGETITWNVWQGNMREANKFVEQVKSRLRRQA